VVWESFNKAFPNHPQSIPPPQYPPQENMSIDM